MSQKKKDETSIQKQEPTYSQRFTAAVVREFGSTVGGHLELSPYKAALAQHLFVGIDTAMRDLEANRIKKGNQGLPIVWSNVNMSKLTLDAVHRIELGLDALIPGHIYPIPYLNGKTGKYDLDLRIGYVGKDYYRRRMATSPPKDIIYQLVHETDEFVPVMAPSAESYTFTIKNPFKRGPVVGGFGYIVYDDPTRNKLVLVSKDDFDKSKKVSGSDKFWGPYEAQMQYKTLVNRVTKHLSLDPEKVNTSYAQVEVDEARAESEREIEEHANGEVIDVDGTWEPSEAEKKEIEEQDRREASGNEQGHDAPRPGF